MDFILIALSALPWAGPGVAVSAATATAWLVVRRLAASVTWSQALMEAMLVGWVGGWASVTLTPGWTIEFGQSRSACGLAPSLPVGPSSAPDRVLNVVIFVPAGVMALVASRWRAGWIAAAVAAPVVAELTQHLFPVLGRACQLADAQDNYQGVLLGAVIGLIWIASVRLSTRGQPGRRSPTSRSGTRTIERGRRP